MQCMCALDWEIKALATQKKYFFNKKKKVINVICEAFKLLDQLRHILKGVPMGNKGLLQKT
jgi:hypothetical protein